MVRSAQEHGSIRITDEENCDRKGDLARFIMNSPEFAENTRKFREQGLNDYLIRASYIAFINMKLDDGGAWVATLEDGRIVRARFVAE